MPQEFQYRRLPAIEKNIADINPESDVRVRILGKIIDKANEVIIVEDSSGKSEIVTSDIDVNVNIGDLIRIFTRVLPLEEGFELRAEIIQDMSKLDPDLYKKVSG